MNRRVLHLRQAIDDSSVPMLDAMAELVEALLHIGDRAGAIAAYREFETRFPVPVANSARLREAYDRALWSQSAELPANLPAPRGFFVGRHAEMAAVQRAIEGERFACLVGPGGIGKSRIALQIARTWISRYHAGVWWIDCSSVTRSETLHSLIARAMRLEDRPYSLDSLLERIGQSAVALVLDCCEGCPGIAAAFARRAIEHSPNIAVLTTSRIALSGAAAVAVPPLPLVAAGHVKRAEVISSDAVRLFTELAVTADPEFTLTDANAALVADICRNVDGVPLALELAAAYLAHADISEVHRRLSHRSLDDLTRTLARTIDWAYRMLSESDAEFLRTISVFPGIWTLDDAVGMGGTRETLDRLVGASLVLSERSESGLTRYRLLDTTREFMRDLLRELGAWESTLARFLRHTLSVAQNYRDGLERADGKAPLQLQDRYEAIAFAIDLGTGHAAFAPVALEIFGTIGISLGMLGFAGDLGSRAAALVESARGGALERTAAFDAALRALGWLANRRGEYQRALAINEELIERARTRGDTAALARNLGLAVVIYCNAGNYDGGLRAAEEAVELSRASGEVQSLSVALRGLACIYLTVGRHADALAPMEAFLALPQDAVPKMQQAMGMCDYADALIGVDRYTDAQIWLQRAIALCMQIHDYGTATHANANLATAYGRSGDMRAAHAAARQAVRLTEQNVNILTQLLAFEELVACAIRDDQLDTLAFLAGYVEGVRRRYNLALAPEREPRSTAIRKTVASRMPRAEFGKAFARGAAASLEQAIEAALTLQPAEIPLEQADRFAALTRREREVADLARTGMSNRAIAGSLCLSVRTVEVHVASIMRKLGIERRDQIVEPRTPSIQA